MDPNLSTTPLPPSWPDHVKSAFLQALGMAHTAMAHIRGRCIDGAAAEVNAVDSERLRSEVELLREELRIKDARMARVPARRRPRYCPGDRLAILPTIDGRTADLEKPYEATRAEACCRRQTRLGPLGLPILTTPLTKRHDLRYILVGRRCKLRARPQREPYLPLVDQSRQPQPLQYPRLLPGGQRHHVGIPLDSSAAVHVDVTRL
jgi:hypothetical protein